MLPRLPRLLQRRCTLLLSRSPPASRSSPRLPTPILPITSTFCFHSSSSSPVAVATHTEPTLQLTFTCTADNCGHRSTHTFSKRSYQSGIVLLQCPGCKSRHLIADHIGWFKESTQNGMFKTVEDLLRAKGELVQRGKLYHDGTIEILPEEKDEQDANP